jgi:lipid-A-disaccharide synthase
MASLLVVAGEASADLHASHVVRALKARRPDLTVAGIGSALCREAGMEVFVDSRDLGVMGFTEVVAALLRVRRAFNACLRWVDDHRPEAALLLDFAGFNLRLARRLHQRGVKVLYFISPKVWASREGRVKAIRAYVDKMLVIFPFEVEYFRARGVEVEYVGNPSLDQLQVPPTREKARRALGLPVEGRVVALLPGSRRAEVARHVPPMVEAAALVAADTPGVRFVVPRAATVDVAMLEPAVAAAKARGLTLDIVEGRAPEVFASADAAIVASGTATLEAALCGTPMVVIYRTSWLSALLAWAILRVAWVSLVNILAGREVVRELLQSRAKPVEIAREVVRIMGPEAARSLRAEFDALRRGLGEPGAPERVATAVLRAVDGAGGG